MNQNNNIYKKKSNFFVLKRIFFGILISLLTINSSYSQTPGLIVEASTPAANPMDPNGDGWITTVTGSTFTAGQHELAEFEIPNFTVVPGSLAEPSGDGDTGAACGATEVISDPSTNSAGAYYAFVTFGGIDYMVFRMRVASNSKGAFGYSFLFDTDNLIGTEDPNSVSGNPGFETEVIYASGSDVSIVNVDGTTNGTTIVSYPNTTNAQKSDALNTICTKADPIFADFFVPTSLLGITSTDNFRVAASTASSPSSSLGGSASDILGTDDDLFPDDDSNFIALINSAYPCDLTDAGKTLETCNNGGTLTDPSDDFVSFSLNPTGSNLGATYTVSVNGGGTISPTSGTYGSATAFTLQAGSANNTLYTITILDVTGGTCSTTTTVQQASCSTVIPCNLTDAGLTGILCSDAGTPTDPSDDTFTFNLNPTGTSIGTSYTVSGGATGTASYGAATNFGPYPISGGNLTITITDDADGACQIVDLVVTAPTTCSTTVDQEAVYTVAAAANVDSYVNTDVLATVTDADGTGVTSAVLASGTLPAGTSLDATTGAITVTDATLLVAGSTSFDVTTTDSTGGTTTQTVTIVLTADQEAVYTVAAAANVDSYVNTDVLATVTDADGTGVTSAVLASGTLPAGTSLDATTGVITVTDATLLVAGSTSFDVTTTDSTGGTTTQTVTIVLTADNEAVYTVAAAANVDSYVNTDVLATVTDADGTGVTSAVLASGTLPAGTSLDATTGAITVTDATLLVAGSTSFDVTTTDSTGGTTTQTVTIVLTADQEAVYTVAAAANVDSYVNTDVLATVTDADGTGVTSAVLASGTLPAGTSLDATTGAITVTDATLLVAGSTSFDVTTTDSTGGTTTQTVTIVLTADNEAVYTVAAAANVDSYVNTDVLATVTDADGTGVTSAVLASGTLPAGTSLDATTGAITVTDATLLVAGSASFDVTTTDSTGGTTTQIVTIVLTADNEAVYTVAAAANVDSYVNTDVLATVTDADGTGVTSAVLASGTLPAGTSLDATTGAITVTDATLLVSGSTSFDVTTTDSTGGTTTQTVTIVLTTDQEAVYTVESAQIVDTYINGESLATVSDADGAITSAVLVNGTTLPAGTILNATTGEITVSDATLLVAGSYDVDITTVDATGGTSTQSITIVFYTDSDGDGVPDIFDLDSDNDGILDTIESGNLDPLADLDGDYIPAYLDEDDNNVAIGDDTIGIEQIFDFDDDGIPNFLDLDSDNDAIPDVIEAGYPDTDNNGLIDSTTFGANGLADEIETSPESGVLVSNPLNSDFSSDNNPTFVLYNFLDVDSDNDGISDVTEAFSDNILYNDVDNNGRVDVVTDLNFNGWYDAAEGVALVFVNSDADALPNYLDLDSDGDGLPDTFEGNFQVPDGDNDGIVGTGIPDDSDGDGLADTNDPEFAGNILGGFGFNQDRDGDGVNNTLDIDIDNDGIIDNIEGQSTFDYRAPTGLDADGDGIDDAYDVDNGGIGIGYVNTDGGSAPDYADTNSDEVDGVGPDPFDLLENNVDNAIDAPLDADNNGIIDPGTLDIDGDGLVDIFDNVNGTADAANATNGGQTALTQPDSDVPEQGDRDWREVTTQDKDQDGIVDTVDLDDDNDGILDVNEDLNLDMDNNPRTNPTDSDGDGEPNYFDLDSDNDGIPDTTEAGGIGIDIDGSGMPGSGVLSGADVGTVPAVDLGVPTIVGTGLTPLDTDGDLIPDFMDLDSDNDGILDVVEAGGIDSEGDGEYGSGTTNDIDADGLIDALDIFDNRDGSANTPLGGTPLTILDSDTDLVPNYLDLDSDNDGVYDVYEAGHGLSQTNGEVDGAVDSNGIPVAIQDTTGLVTYVLADSETTPDGTPDYIELDADGDGCNDVIEAGFTDADTDGIIGDLPLVINANGVVTGTNIVDGYTEPNNVDATIPNAQYDFQQPGISPTIASLTDQPQDVITNGVIPVTFTVNATGIALSYQWQVDNGTGFVDIDSANLTDIYTGSDTAILTLTGVTSAENNYQYHVIIAEDTFICSTTTSNSAVLTIDTIAPAVTIDQALAQADPTNVDSATFTVVFTEAIDAATFVAGDISLAGTTGTVTSLTTTDNITWTAVVTGMTDGDVVEATIAAGAASDPAGNTNTVSTSTDNTVTFDATPPAVTIDQAVGQADPTNVDSATFTVVFTEAIDAATFVAGDISLAGTTGTVTSLTTTDSITWTAVVTGMTDGDVVEATIAAGAASDPAGNTNTVSTSTDNTVTFDATPPAVTIDQAVGQADPTNVDSATFTIVFTEAIDAATFVAGDISLAGTTGTVTSLTTTDSITWTAVVTGMTDGDVVEATIATGAVSDPAGNTNTVSTSTDNTVIYDATPPDVTIDQALAQADPTNVDSATFTVVFTEAIDAATFVAGDISLAGTTGTVTSLTTTDSITWTAVVTGMTDGDVVEATIAAGAASDPAGNTNTVSTSTDNTVIYDATPPDVTIDQASGQADPTNVDSATFTVVFTEAIDAATFVAGDISLAGTTGTVTSLTTTDSITWTAVVTGMTDGDVVEATIAAGAASDPAGNTNTVSTSTDNTVIYDATPPDVTIDQASGQADPTNVDSATFTVVFTEAIDAATFVAGDISLAGTTGTVTSLTTTDNITWTAVVTGMTDGDVVEATIAAGAASDPAGNTNTVSTSTDNTVTFDATPPAVTIDQAVGQADPTNVDSATFTIVFTEAIDPATFVAGDISLSGTSGIVTSLTTTDSITWTAVVTGMTDGDVVEATIAAGATSDPAGNINTVSTFTDNTVTYDVTPPTAPVVTIDEDTNNDGLISSDELSADGLIDVTVELPADALVGDSLIIMDGNGNTHTIVLTAIDITNGTVGTTFSNPGDGNTLNVTASITDVAGNIGASSVPDTAMLDLTDPTAPVVTIDEDTNNDGLISEDELVGDVDVTITLPTDAVEGDTVTVLDGNGNTQTIVLTATDISNGTVSTTFPSPGDGNTLSVTASITDVAGNVGASSVPDTATLDLTDPTAPVVTIVEDTNNDGLISSDELSADGLIDVTIDLPGDAVEGDTVTVLDGNGNTQIIVLTATDITNGTVGTTFSNPGDGNSLSVTASITDVAGNVGASSVPDTAMLDLTDPTAPVVTIDEDTNNDGLISEDELVGDLDVTITLPTDAVEGDTVTVLDGNGNTQTIVLTAIDITNGTVSTTFPSPGDGNTLSVTASITDVAGNVGASSVLDTATLDLTDPTAPVVTIVEDTNNDGLISSDELSADGLIDVTIDLPADAVAGDSLTVMDGNGNTQIIVLTATDITNGTVGTTFSNPGDGNTLNVTASITDVAGNVGASSTPDTATLDLTFPTSPTVITEDANNDGFINEDELSADGLIDVTIILPTDAVAGDTLTVIDGNGNTQTIILTATDITNGTVSTTFPSPGDGNSLTVTANITDAAGNIGPNSEPDSAILDLTDPTAPVVTIDEDTNNDGLISSDELSADGLIDITIALPGDALAGDSLTIMDGNGNTHTIVLTAIDIINGTVGLTFSNPGDGNSLSVTASITDVAGNVGASSVPDTAMLDLTGPTAPVVMIDEDTNNDGLISEDELVGDVDVTITLPTDAVEGDTVTVLDGNGNTQTIVLTAIDITNRTVSTTFPSQGDGNTLSVTASITDVAGNVGASSVPDTATLDLTDPTAPVVTIDEDTNNDGLINEDELSADGLIDVTIDLPSDALAGDSLTIMDGNGNTQTIVLTATDITNGTVGTTFSNPGDGNSLSITASITDVAGNVGASSVPDTAMLDLTDPTAPVVTIDEDTNNDGLISEDELVGDVDVTITLPTDVVEGDTVTVLDGNGNAQTIVLTATDITNGTVSTTFPSPGDGTTLSVTASITDVAGNVGPSSVPDTATLDLTAPTAPVVTINEDTNNDGLISSDELSADGLIDVTIDLPGDAVAGDSLTVMDGNGNTQTIVLTATDITNGTIGTTFSNPGDGNTLSVTASITDVAGNVGASSVLDTAILNLAAPTAPMVTVTEDANNDGFINEDELSVDGLIDITITLPTDALAGDIVTVLDGNGNTQTIVLTATDIINGTVGTTFPSPGDGNSLSVTANITDVAGNVGSSSEPDTATLDLTDPTAPVVTIDEDTNNDGLISEDELVGDVNVTIDLPSDALAGDTVTVLDGNGNTQTIVLTATDIINVTVGTTFPSPGDGNSLSVTASITDVAGNVGPSSVPDTATLNLTDPTAPTVMVTEDANNDGWISEDELVRDIDVIITLPSDAVAGSTVTVIDGNGNTQTIVLTTTDIANGTVSTTFPSPGDSNSVTVTANITDVAGNVGANSVPDTATLDLTDPTAPDVVIDEDINNDGLINASELIGDIEITVTLPSDAVVGDTVIVEDENGNTQTIVLTATDITNGTVSTSIPSSGEETTLVISANIVDEAGNTSVLSFDTAFIDAETITGDLAIIASLPGDILIVSLSDSDLNKNPSVIETINVIIINEKTGESETVVLTETGPNTGIFTATVQTNYGTTAGANDDGIFNVQSGDDLTVSYSDELDVLGNPTTIFDTDTIYSTVSTNDDAIVIEETGSTELYVVDNDENIPTTGTLVITQPLEGTVTIDDNGTPNDPSDDIINYTPNDTFVGEDSFQYTICDAFGNCDSALINISIEEPLVGVIIPESFSPNGDGINDVFEVKYLEGLYPDFSMEIINRYGNKVYEYKHNGNPNQTPVWWDGYSNGRWNFGNGELPSATYFYTIYFNKENRKPKTGWIYLKR